MRISDWSSDVCSSDLPATAAALRDAFTAFAADERARVALLTGSEGHFCAGFDLGAVGTTRYDPDGPGPMGPTRMTIDKPVIAAIGGHAVEGGLEPEVWIDLRCAAKRAVFGVRTAERQVGEKGVRTWRSRW